MEKSINYERWLEVQQYRKTSIKRLLGLAEKSENYWTKEGLQRNELGFKNFLKYCCNQGYSKDYIYQIQWGMQTYCNYLKQVKGQKIKLFLIKQEAKEQSRIALNASALKKVKVWLEQEQADYCLNQLLWSLFYGSGLRRKEALNINLKDIDLRHKVLYINSLKTGKSRTLPLSNSQVLAIVNYQKEERPIAKVGYESKLLLGRRGGNAQSLLGIQLLKWQEGTGLESKLCWHVLRHTIATNLVERGLKIELLSRFLGHKNVASTGRYLHYLKENTCALKTI
jgi:integrase/recombinase XerD